MKCKAVSRYSDNRVSILKNKSFSDEQKMIKIVDLFQFDLSSDLEELSEKIYTDIFIDLSSDFYSEIGDTVGISLVYNDGEFEINEEESRFNSPFINYYSGITEAEITEKKADFFSLVEDAMKEVLNSKTSSVQNEDKRNNKSQDEGDPVGDTALKNDIQEKESESLTVLINNEARKINGQDSILLEKELSSVYFKNNAQIFNEVFIPEMRFKARKNIFGGIDESLSTTVDINLDGEFIARKMLVDIINKYSLSIPTKKQSETGEEILFSNTVLIENINKSLENRVNYLFSSNTLNGVVDYPSVYNSDMYLDYVFINEIESVIENIMPLIKVSKNRRGAYEFKINEDILNSDNFSGSHGEEGHKKADQNTEFIRFFITSTPNIISIDSVTTENTIEWFSDEFERKENTSDEDYASEIKDKLKSRGIDFIQDKANPFLSFDQYMGATVSEDMLLSDGTIDNVNSILENKFGELNNTFRFFFSSADSKNTYLDIDNKRMEARSLSRNFSNLSIKESYNPDGSISVSGDVNSNYQKVITALYRDIVSHETRNNIKYGKVVKNNQLDVTEQVDQLLNDNLTNPQETGLHNDLFNKVYFTSDSDGNYLNIDLGEKNRIIKVKIKAKGDFSDDTLFIEADGTMSNKDMRDALKALNFPSSLIDRNGLFDFFSRTQNSLNLTLDNFIVNYAMLIRLNETTDANGNTKEDTVLSNLMVNNPEKSAPGTSALPYDVYSLLWKYKADFRTFAKEIFGVDGNNMLIGVDGGKVTSVTVRSNSNFNAVLKELNDIDTHSIHEGNNFTTGKFKYKGKGFKSDSFVHGEKTAPSQLYEGDMVVQSIRDYFVPSLVESKNRNALLQLTASERKLVSVHEIEFAEKAIPVTKDGKVNFEKLKDNFVTSKKRYINNINKSFQLELSRIFDIDNDALSSDFKNNNRELLFKTMAYMGLGVNESLTYINTVQNGIKSSIKLTKDNNDNFMYIFNEFLKSHKIPYDYASVLGLKPNEQLHELDGTWSINDFMVYESDFWNNNTSVDAYEYKDGKFNKINKPRYDEASVALKPFDFVTDKMNKFVNSRKKYLSNDIINDKQRKKVSETLGLKNRISDRDLLRAYHLLTLDVNENYSNIMMGTDYQYLTKVKSYKDFVENYKDKENVRDAYIFDTLANEDKAKVKRNGLLESRGLTKIISKKLTSSSKTEKHLFFNDPNNLIKLLGVPDDIKSETYDGQQFIDPLTAFQRKVAYGSWFGYNIDGFLKDITFSRNHTTGTSTIEKTATHVLSLKDLHDDESGFLEKMWSIPFRDANGKFLKVFLPKDGDINNDFIPFNEEVSSLTDADEIFYSNGQIENMYDVFEYLGGFSNPNVIEDMAKVIGLPINADIRNLRANVATFMSSAKSGTPVLNDLESFQKNNKPVFTYDIQARNNLLILNKYENVEDSHLVSLFTQAYQSVNFGLDKESGRDAINAINVLKELNVQEAEGQMKSYFYKVFSNEIQNNNPYSEIYIDVMSAINTEGISVIDAILEVGNINENAAEDILKNIIQMEIKDNIVKTNSSDLILGLAYSDNISLNGILSKITSSMLRTNNIKQALNIKQNGINTVAQNVNGMIKIYELKEGSSTTMRRTEYLKASKKRAISGVPYKKFNKIDKISITDLFNKLLSKEEITLVEC